MIVANFAALADSPSPAGTWAGTLDKPLTITGLQKGDAVKLYRVLEYDQTAKDTGSWALTEKFASITPDQLNKILGLGDYATGKTKAIDLPIKA